MRNIKFMTNALIAAAYGAGINSFPRGKIWRDKSEKECLKCGTLHQHNNSFCSADCCKTYNPQ